MYCMNPEGFIWMTTYITLVFSQNLTAEEMDVWGNILSAVGSNLSALSSIYGMNDGSNASNSKTNDSQEID